LPQAQRTVATTYLGWMPVFIGIASRVGVNYTMCRLLFEERVAF